MKMVIDFDVVEDREFVSKDTGEVINYKVFEVDFGQGARFMTMNKLSEAIKALKVML